MFGELIRLKEVVLVLSYICSLTMCGASAISRTAFSFTCLGPQLRLSARMPAYGVHVGPGLPSMVCGCQNQASQENQAEAILFVT